MWIYFLTSFKPSSFLPYIFQSIMFNEKEKRSKFHEYGFVLELHFCRNYISCLVKERKRLKFHASNCILKVHFLSILFYFMSEWDRERDWNCMHLGLSWNFIYVHSIMFSEKEILKSHVNSLRGLLHFICVCHEKQSFDAFLTSFKTIGFLTQNCEHVCLFVCSCPQSCCLIGFKLLYTFIFWHLCANNGSFEKIYKLQIPFLCL